MVIVPSDTELVDAAAETNDPAATPLIADLGSAVRVFLTTRADGLNIIAIEGTHNLPGWALDFCALGIKDHPGINHSSLGFIHSGFYASAMVVLPRVALAAARGPYALAGHSLGAALALLLGGLLIDDNMPPVKIGAFAPPRVGSDKFVRIVSTVPHCVYAYGNDPVPRVPFRIMPLWPYQQLPLTQIGQPEADEFACHNIKNYVTGVHAHDAAAG